MNFAFLWQQNHNIQITNFKKIAMTKTLNSKHPDLGTKISVL